MKILLAPDKFKGSLTAQQVCDALMEGLLKKNPSHEMVKVPLADGGEGTFELLMDHYRGQLKTVSVLDPLFRPIESTYGISSDGKTALIEMARASGLLLLKESERNPLHTSTIGTGQLVAHALDAGVTHIVLGIGGSATNDAGIGMAHALGVRFRSAQGEDLVPIGSHLDEIAVIDDSQKHPRLGHVTVTVLCDVTNPLLGPQGAAYVYGPQKGATATVVAQLDKGLHHLAALIKKNYGQSLDFPGAGAAGGLGAGCKFFLNANIRRGIEYISEAVNLEEKIRWCDHVITGEGKVDEQTFSGKVPVHVIEKARSYGKLVTLVCGQSVFTEMELQQKGVDRLIALTAAGDDSEYAMRNAHTELVKKIGMI